MSLALTRDGAATKAKNAGSSERKIKHWIPDQVGDDSKGKNRYDEIPREVLRFARDKLGMTMMVRLAPHSGNE